MRCEAVLSEIIEEMNIPTPGSMEHSMYKKDRCWMLTPDRVSGNHFEFHNLCY
jgi:hypothetical protein